VLDSTLGRRIIEDLDGGECHRTRMRGHDQKLSNMAGTGHPSGAATP
jgi:hypothetical protein